MDDQEEGRGDWIEVQAGFGARSRRPMVALRARGVEVQMRPATALRVSDQLRGAAYAALSDAAAVAMVGTPNTDEDMAAILAQLRAARERIDEQEGTGDR